jgi:nucleoporin NUP159
VKPNTSYTFQKLTDPIEPFGDKPPKHSILRLRDFPPNMDDLLIVASTAVENIGLFTKSKTALTGSLPAGQITNVFTTTELADDSRRAQLPMAEDYSDTFPVGVALDLSSKDKVYKPIPTDEIEQSPGPLPGLWVLTNEGILVSWWVVYNESIRQGTTYPGLVTGEASAPSQPAAPASSQPTAFGAKAPAFGAPPALGAGSSPWGQQTATTSSPSRAPAFGQSSFGAAPSSSSTAAGAPAFGAPAFGSPSTPAFGQSSTMGVGMRTSPWATGSAASSTPAFGQSSFASAATPLANPFASKGASTASPFATISTSATSSGGFAGFASKGGFASTGSGTTGGSIFGSGKSSGTFGAPSSEVPVSGETAFPPPAQKNGTSSTFGSTPFVLGTTFKADPVTASANEKPPQGGSSMFNSGFGLSLDDASANDVKDEDMDAPTPAVEEPPKTKTGFESTTPTTTPAPSKFFTATTTSTAPTAGNSIFGGFKPAAIQSGSLFGAPSLFQKKPDSETVTPKIKEEEEESPLPPDAISKAIYSLASSSSSSGTGAPSPKATKTRSNKIVDDVALPPDPTPAERRKVAQEPALPPDPTAAERRKVAREPALPPDPTAAERKKVAQAPALPPDPTAAERRKVAQAPALPPDPTAADRRKVAQTPAIPSIFAKPLTKLPEAKTQTPAFPNPFAMAKQPSTDTTLPNPFAALKKPLPPADGDSDDGEGSTDKPQAFVNPFANKLPLPEEDSSDDDDEEFEDGEDEEEPADELDGEGEEEDEDVEENEDYAGTEGGTEGSGVDVAHDLSPTTTTGFGQTPGFTPQSSFAGMAGSTFSATSQVDDRGSALFGEVGGRQTAMFRPPPQRSPQSPSPERKPQSSVPFPLLRNESQRSVSAPGMASEILFKKPLPGFAKPLAARSIPVQDVNVVERRKAEAKKQAEESRVLVDAEYELLEHQLDAPVEPTLQMPECVYQLGNEVQGGASIASQAEAVYRDINRMVQSLKANARNLSAFIAGHLGQGRSPQAPRTKNDLEYPDGWILCDIGSCSEVLDQTLARELEQSRPRGEDAAKRACEELLREVTRLRAMRDDMARIIVAQIDPDQAATSKALPLSAEQAAQQNDLRREFTSVSNKVAEAEQELTVLKARLASAGGASGTAPPTVDAVLRTIHKMTSMAEKRSGDIDVLENQMRMLGISSFSRESSPFVGTPQKNRASVFLSNSAQRSLTSSVASLGGARGTPPRKKLNGYSDEEKKRARQKRDGRQQTLHSLRAALEKQGPMYMGMDND